MLSALKDRPEPVATKVPEITALFWVIKLLTTGMGEATSDFLGGLPIPLAVPLIALALGLFAAAMRRQLLAERYEPVTYWLAVMMVAVFGTVAADALHAGLQLPYAASTAVYALVLAGVFRRWRATEGTVSIHSITSRRRETYYWTTVLVTFALGTAAGDLTADGLGLGFFSSIWLFGVAILVPLVAWRLGLDPVVAFWTAYVITRPLGASVADWIGKPPSFAGGLGFGDGGVSGIALVAIVALVAWVRSMEAQPALIGSGRPSQ